MVPLGSASAEPWSSSLTEKITCLVQLARWQRWLPWPRWLLAPSRPWSTPRRPWSTPPPRTSPSSSVMPSLPLATALKEFSGSKMAKNIFGGKMRGKPYLVDGLNLSMYPQSAPKVADNCQSKKTKSRLLIRRTKWSYIVTQKNYNLAWPSNLRCL